MWTIIEKEFFDDLLNQRFLAGILVSVVLTVGAIALQTSEYAKQLEEYRESSATHENFLDSIGPENFFLLTPLPLIPPEPLSLLANGLRIEYLSNDFDENFLPGLFPVMDLVFIVSIIMSLLALLFSHDSICGEKERGTLRLIVSNSVPRSRLILCKWLGGTASIMLPFLISCLLGLIYISISPSLQLHLTDLAAFVLVVIASLSLISLFYLLGLMVSAMTVNSSTSALTCIFLWVLIVFVVPNLGPYLAAQVAPVESIAMLNQLRSQGQQEKDRQELQKRLDQISDKYETEYGQMFTEYQTWTYEEKMARSGMQAPESPLRSMGLKYRKEIRDRRDEFYQAQRDKLEMLAAQIKIESQKQSWLARNLAAVSPFTDYLYLATEFAGTGVQGREYASRQIESFVKVFVDYVQTLLKRSGLGESVGLDQLKNLKLDLSGRPRFEYKPQPLAERVELVLPYWAVILLFNVLFFVGAFVGFLRYDVR